MVILAGSSNVALAKAISLQLRAYRLKRTIRKFPNGELSVRLLDDVKGQTVVILQGFQAPIHEHLMELLLLADAAKRQGASTIIGVIPWLAYSRQDRVFQSGEPLSAQVIVRVISSAPIDKLFVIDLHTRKELDFFTIPVEHLTLLDEFVLQMKPNSTKNTVVVSPDAGGVMRSVKFAKLLGLPMALIEKTRDKETGNTTATSLSAPVSGKDCVIFDDVIATGSTVVTNSAYLKSNGARSVTFCATHGSFDRGFSVFDPHIVDNIIVSDTIPVPDGVPDFVGIVSAAGTITRALQKEQ